MTKKPSLSGQFNHLPNPSIDREYFFSIHPIHGWIAPNVMENQILTLCFPCNLMVGANTLSELLASIFLPRKLTHAEKNILT